jgi:hypothetical protein
MPALRFQMLSGKPKRLFHGREDRVRRFGKFRVTITFQPRDTLPLAGNTRLALAHMAFGLFPRTFHCWSHPPVRR